MKKLFKYLSIVLFLGGFLSSCETTELELLENPNVLSTTQADPNLLLNQIQLSFNGNMTGFNGLGGQLTRINYMFGRNYFNNFSGATFNGIWSNTYSGIFKDVEALQGIDAESDTDYSFHIGVGQTLKAYSLFLLIDYLGEAAFSQALNPAEFPNPGLDSGPDVYAAAFALLTEAEGLLSGSPATQGAQDLYYNGDASKWVKLINTIRLRSYFNTGDTGAFNAIIAGGNYISSSADDFQFQYGTQVLNPDVRHPDYAADYTASGANIYQSNWLMENMLNKDDPRIRYYFYRQVNATPGADAPANEETLSCSLVVPPPHFTAGGFTYCSVPNGYWGRTHGNDEGTPPDNFTRVAVGVYPAAGRFDDSAFTGVGLGLGGAGAGIEPILMSSYVDFWQGELATAPADKAAFMQAGMEKSIAKVQGFGALDGSADMSMAPDAAANTAYVDGIVADYLAAAGDDQANIFAEQYWIALYGGAAEAYNYYRKTGFPSTLTPNWELDPGPFPRTFLLPDNEIINNDNLTQRTDMNLQVFWDTNPAGPAFPPSN